MSYPYQTLDLRRETRILTIQPSENDDDDIVCSLTHIDIDAESGTYDALSYCWSKSVSNPANFLDKQFVPVNTGLGIGQQFVKPRDLLGHPELEYWYIRYGGVLPAGHICCDGIKVTVSGELFRALKEMRSFYKATRPRLWVDALCIDQGSVQERNEHVKVMGKIYANAAIVRVWLGESIGIEYGVADQIKKIYAIKKESMERGYQYDEHPGWAEVKWVVLGQFLSRAWVKTNLADRGVTEIEADIPWQFERIWVVQEIVNAKYALLHCGNVVIDWDPLQMLLGYVRQVGLEHKIANPAGMHTVIQMAALREGKGNPNGHFRHDLPMILDAVRNLKATITSDRVYGVLGLLSDPAEVQGIQVDYTKSTEEIFTDLAVDYLQRRKSLAFLPHCALSTRPRTVPKLSLPSWVPDWTAPGWAEPFRTRAFPSRAAGNTVPQIIEVNRAAGILGLKGRLLDKIRAVDYTAQVPEMEFAFPEVEATYPEDRNATIQRRELHLTSLVYKEWANIFLLAVTNPAAPEEETGTSIWDSVRHENLWRTMMCNCTRDTRVPEKAVGAAWDPMLKFALEFTKSCSSIVPSGTVEDSIEALSGTGMREHAREYLKNRVRDKEIIMMRGHRTWTFHRRFFVSSNGRFGWGVDGTKAGDEVVLFYGCDYPFVVRRDSQGSGWRIIGDCYIHGLMDGEGIRDGFEEKEFVML